MSGHPQGGQYDDGYGQTQGHAQGQQGQDAYYHDDAHDAHGAHGAQYQQQGQHGDAYYDEQCVLPRLTIYTINC